VVHMGMEDGMAVGVLRRLDIDHGSRGSTGFPIDRIAHREEDAYIYPLCSECNFDKYFLEPISSISPFEMGVSCTQKGVHDPIHSANRSFNLSPRTILSSILISSSISKTLGLWRSLMVLRRGVVVLDAW
jgi:hypothetical protein